MSVSKDRFTSTSTSDQGHTHQCVNTSHQSPYDSITRIGVTLATNQEYMLTVNRRTYAMLVSKDTFTSTSDQSLGSYELCEHISPCGAVSFIRFG